MRPGHTDRTYRIRLRMAVSGDATLQPVTVNAQLRVVEILAGSNPREIWFYSASPARPVELPDGRLLLFSADLSPGIWMGPGTYVLGDESGVRLGETEGLSSGAYVQLYRPRDITEFGRYDILERPCTLTVAEEDLTGTVACPALASSDGGTVALHWNWERR